MTVGLRLHVTLCAVALAVPWLPLGPASSPSRFPGWPTELDGVPLRPVAFTEGEAALARELPGRMAKRTDGHRQIVLRFLERDTRLFHSSADCMKGLGYAVHPRPTVIDDRGRRWGAFEAVRDGKHLLVRERIYEAAGERSFTDVSSWYWAAVLGRSAGPWWAILIAEAAPENAALDGTGPP